MKIEQIENLEDKVRDAHSLLYQVWSEATSSNLPLVAQMAHEAILPTSKLSHLLEGIVADDEEFG